MTCVYYAFFYCDNDGLIQQEDTKIQEQDVSLQVIPMKYSCRKIPAYQDVSRKSCDLTLVTELFPTISLS